MSGKVYQDCPNSRNPYHECNDRCLERKSFGDVLKKEKKKPITFGKPRKETPPSSPARGNKSPLPSYYAKRLVVKSDESPSFSSSDDAFNSNLSTPRSPLNGNKAETGNYWLPMSPSLSDYCKKDYLASRFDHLEGQASIHSGKDNEMSPKTPEHPLRTPKHRPSTNIALETRPRTPKREFITLEPRAKSPEYKVISPRTQSKTPEPQARTHEPHRPRIPQTQPISSHRSLDSGHGLRSPRKDKTKPHTLNTKATTLESMLKAEEYQARSPDHRARSLRPESRIPHTQPNHHSTVQRSPQASKYHDNKTFSVYIEEEEEECVILVPKLLLSPQKSPSSRPITTFQPKKHQDFFYQLDEPESINISDSFSYLDGHGDDSDYLFPEIATPLHPKSRKSSNKQSDDRPELSDKCHSVTLCNIERKKALKIYEPAEEKTQSMISESYVSIGSYKVRSSVSHTLKQILDKHGDIASGSKLESLTTTSYCLETLAALVLELQSTPLKKLNETRVLEMLAVVKDVESVKIRAGWLIEVLNEILEAAKHYDRHETSVMEKEVYERDVLLGRQEMEKVLKEVRLKEKEVKEFRKGVMETMGRLGELEMKRARLEKRLAFLSSKVEMFVGKSVLENVV